MAILTISRDWGVDPSLVRITTDDDLATMTAAGYLTDEADNIEALQNGAFEWLDNDSILIAYTGDSGLFTRDAVNNAFVLDVVPVGALPLVSAHILVGSAANIATDVAMTGDIAITNTGVTSIVGGVIVNADVNAAAAIAYSKLAALPAANVLVGSAGNVATAVAMTGVIAITDAGLTSIVDGSIVNADVNAAAAIDYSKLAALPSAEILVGSAGNVATAVAMTGDVAISNAGATTIQAGAIDLAMLSAGITPSHITVFAGQPTTVGGAAAEAFVIAGVLNTDLAFVQIVDDGGAAVTVLQAVCTANTLTITFSANPGNDAIFNYQILRAAA